MTVKADRSSLLKITFYVTTVLTVMFDIDPTEGLRWVKTPSDITKCADETLNLTWEYEKEENEDIRQFQWRFNSSTLIAYRAVDNGLHIDEKYHGRVKESGVTGIILKNITVKDIGNYSLYIIIAWKQTPVIHSMWLNVIDAEAVQIPQWCTCERLQISQEWNGGRNINVTDGCRLKVNSSHCCVRKPVNRCKDNNPQDLCRPFPGQITQIENVTPVSNTNQLTENEGPKCKDIEVNTTVNTFHLITLIFTCVISLVLTDILIFWCWRKRQLCTKKCQMENIEVASKQDEGQETPMLTEIDTRKHQSYHGNQKYEREGNRSLQVLQLLSCEDCAELSKYIEELETLLNQQNSQGRLDEKVTLGHRTRASTWTKNQNHRSQPSSGENGKDISDSGTDLSNDILPMSSKVRVARQILKTIATMHGGQMSMVED